MLDRIKFARGASVINELVRPLEKHGTKEDYTKVKVEVTYRQLSARALNADARNKTRLPGLEDTGEAACPKSAVEKTIWRRSKSDRLSETADRPSVR
jgi:hypothetical protein